MIANFGFKDGSGDWFIAIDTDKCNSCGKCVSVCPPQILETGENEYDPLAEGSMAKVKTESRKKIRYTCAPCQPGYGAQAPPCILACEPAAISISDGWKLAYGKK